AAPAFDAFLSGGGEDLEMIAEAVAEVPLEVRLVVEALPVPRRNVRVFRRDELQVLGIEGEGKRPRRQGVSGGDREETDLTAEIGGHRTGVGRRRIDADPERSGVRLCVDSLRNRNQKDSQNERRSARNLHRNSFLPSP